jgi:hypothetical protein
MRRATLFSFGACAVLCGTAVDARAQSAIGLNARDVAYYTNNPCTNADISWALWREKSNGLRPAGGIGDILDCDRNNYGAFASERQLLAAVNAYRTLLRKQEVATVIFVGDNGHAYGAVAKGHTVAFGIDAGLVKAGRVTPLEPSPLVPASILMARGAQNAVKTVVVPGSIVVAHDGGEFVQGQGDWRGGTAPGELVVQFPSRWVRVVPPSKKSVRLSRRLNAPIDSL